MNTQKDRWAAKAAQYREWGDKAQAQAEALVVGHERYRGDVAFWTQPGRIPERDRMHARSLKAYELGQKAKKFHERAANLERLATTNAGDAARRLQAERDANPFAVGAQARSIHYGPCVILKVNRNTYRIRTASGFEVLTDKAWVS
mgnify:CR=1 FL=1